MNPTKIRTNSKSPSKAASFGIKIKGKKHGEVQKVFKTNVVTKYFLFDKITVANVFI